MSGREGEWVEERNKGVEGVLERGCVGDNMEIALRGGGEEGGRQRSKVNTET